MISGPSFHPFRDIGSRVGPLAEVGDRSRKHCDDHVTAMCIEAQGVGVGPGLLCFTEKRHVQGNRAFANPVAVSSVSDDCRYGLAGCRVDGHDEIARSGTECLQRVGIFSQHNGRDDTLIKLIGPSALSRSGTGKAVFQSRQRAEISNVGGISENARFAVAIGCNDISPVD